MDMDTFTDDLVDRVAVRVLERLRRPLPSRNGDMRRLTDMQFAVARLAMAGGSAREIGTTLGISPRTVEVHKADVAHRLGVRTFVDAVLVLTAVGVTPDYARLGREPPPDLSEQILPLSEVRRRASAADITGT